MPEVTSTERFVANRQTMLFRLREFLADPTVPRQDKAETAGATIDAIRQMAKLALEKTA